MRANLIDNRSFRKSRSKTYEKAERENHEINVVACAEAVYETSWRQIQSYCIKISSAKGLRQISR